MKTAIITGITGQDGAYLARFLVDKGYQVIGIRRSLSVNLFNLKYLSVDTFIIWEECDLLDLSYVISMIEKYQPDEIYNLAAQSSVGLSFQQPTATIHFNVISVLNLLEAIRMVNKSIKFYQASSSEMYGKVTTLPVTLSTPMHPLSPYAISKASGFWTVVNFRESFNLFACNGILFNHESYLRARTFFVKKVITDSLLIKAGKLDFLKVGNLDVRRDFGYAPSYVEAMWLILQHKEPKDFIICSGTSVLLHEIVNSVFEKLDIDFSRVKIDEALYRPVEIYDMYGDNSESKQLLGWRYDMKFDQVIDELIKEEQKNLISSNSF